MLDTTFREIPRLGLTALEQMSVKAISALLPCGWHVALEATDSHEVYARVVPPWSSGVSAFLIDREGHGVILTDNISDDTHPVISVMLNVDDAIDYVVTIVSSRVDTLRNTTLSHLSAGR